MLDLSKDYCIGYSSMDNDMEIVEAFVRYYHARTDLATFSVKSYYLFAISNYWNTYKDFIMRIDTNYLSDLLGKIGGSFEKGLYVEKLKEWIEGTIRRKIYESGNGLLLYMWEECKNYLQFGITTANAKNIEDYLRKTIEYTNILQENIDTDERDVKDDLNKLYSDFDIITATKSLVVIANKYCISTKGNNGFNSPTFSKVFLKDNVYPLYSTNGHFAYNTYLYALFSGIHLVGIPNKYSVYDGKLGCPEAFYLHDGGHIINGNVKEDELFLLSVIYQKIIFDRTLSKMLKEEMIQTMFYWIHEPNAYINSPQSLLKNFDKILELYKEDELQFYKTYDINSIELDVLAVENFIDLNGKDSQDVKILDEIFGEYNSEYANEIIINKLKENLFYSDVSDQSDLQWLSDKATSIRYCSALCNMRLMRYISDNTYI